MEMVLKVTLKMLSSFWAILGSFWGPLGTIWGQFVAPNSKLVCGKFDFGAKIGPKWFLNGPEMTKIDFSV